MHALLDVTLVHQDGGYASDESFHATRLGTLAQLRVRGLLNAKKVSP